MNDLAKSSQTAPRKAKPADHGKLKIGDDWNAIRIIVLAAASTANTTSTVSDDGEGSRAMVTGGPTSSTWPPTSAIRSSGG